MRLLDARASRELDRLSCRKYGVESFALMRRAGEAVAAALLRRRPEARRTGVLVVCGRGNNGGDGLVAARALAQAAVPVRLALLGRAASLSGDAARALGEWRAGGQALVECLSAEMLEPLLFPAPGVVVDAIVGTGLANEVSGLARAAIEQINRCGAAVVAVDIASGVDADTGAVMGDAVRASLTVTFGFAKFGHVSYPGAAFCGELQIADIGFAPQAVSELPVAGWLTEAQEARALLRPRPPTAHKGLYGHVLVIAGSQGKAGAAMLAADGALRAGAGLVTAVVPQSVAAVVAGGRRELMTEAAPEREGRFDPPRTVAMLERLVEGKTVLVAGPGVGANEEMRELVLWLISKGCTLRRPLVLDADGLNVLALVGVDTLGRAGGPVLVTPHPGEMARLLRTSAAEVNANRVAAARRLIGYNAAGVLLKGARSVIAGAQGEIRINSSGNPGMAGPGMGDGLAGIVAALVAQGYAAVEALALGAYLHGAAADRVARLRGPVGYLAGEVLEALPGVLAELGC